MLEGLHLLQAWLASGRYLSSVLVSESGLQHLEIFDWLNQVQSTDIYELSDRLFAQIAESETPAGILAWVPYPQEVDTPCFDQDTVLLDGVQDPGNLGTLLRTTAAAGIRQILLSENCSACWSGKALRAGQGAQFILRIHEHADLIAFLKEFRGQSIATSLTDAKNLYARAVLQLDKPLAWVFGSEGMGVSQVVQDSVQSKIKIPMLGQIDSLNVAAAAAICLFEMVRQRECKASKFSEG